MKKIAITGGKGGTGKSTVAVLKAAEFLKKGKKVVLVDCDVECPNDYLLLGSKLEKEKEKIYGEFPFLIKEKCQKCSLCVRICRENAVFQKPGDFPVFLENLCTGCGACWAVCPHGAIKTGKKEIGKIHLNRVKDLILVTGEAKPGLEETGPVVEATKRFAENIAKNADIIIFDTAAGTHCPVINALMGVDLAYAVTEPTPMGGYDLKLILELCKKMDISAKIILNQADLGDKKKIVELAEKFKTEITREIPHSKELVKAYSRGEMLNVEFK